MTFATTSTSPHAQQHQQQQQHQQNQHQKQSLPLSKRRAEKDDSQGSFRIKKCPQHLLAYRILTMLVFLCLRPDFIVALKDVSVTIPQAVKRGSNAMLTCNYDMENDTLYSVKWYKGRREFYRYTPKENPAMKVFPSQSGLNVERNLSNQSHVVLLAVPLNISGKFTCEISVEAPSFQTAMVSGDMEVVELPEEQATVTGIQPRYRIGDLVDGNCSIKYSKPAANLTWTINGIVVPPHHIKTYQIEKYEEINLESVMSAVHFMVTTQHFIKGQMRLKCTASIFDIFKEEIESIIEEDRPRIMASGQSYPPDHGYGTHGETDGYEHNESYLTYFSAPKSSGARTAEFALDKILKLLKHKVLENYQLLRSLIETKTEYVFSRQHVNSLALNNLIKRKTKNCNIFEQKMIKFIMTALAIVILLQQKLLVKSLGNILTQDKQMTFNCIEKIRQMMKKKKDIFLAMNFWHKEKEQKKINENCYQDANDVDDDDTGCQASCGQQNEDQQQQKQPQQHHCNEHCLVAHQNLVNEKVFLKDTNITTIQTSTKNKTIATPTTNIDCQNHMSSAFAFVTSCTVFHKPPSSTFFPSSPLSKLQSPSSSSTTTSLSLSTTLSCRKTYAHDSFPLYSIDASKSNNAKYMSKDQTLLMNSTATAVTITCIAIVVVTAAAAASNTLYKTPSAFALLTPTSVRALVLEPKLLPTSVLLPSHSYTHSSPTPIFSRNNYLMAFIGELLLHQC